MSSKLKPFASYKNENKAEFQEVFKAMALEVGREQVERGINNAIMDTDREMRGIHPSPADFKAYVKAAAITKALWKAADPNCHFCAGDGWMTDPRKPGYVTKCDCRRIA